MTRKPSPTDVVRPLRAAIYTRKSHENGLEQEFNSLDAQRADCEAYVRGQRALGWVLVDDRFDDGAYSGGTLERPALDRLRRDIAAGRIQVIVCQRLDRLTRSLRDFHDLIQEFDQHDVAFVSATQSFNTRDSMGRLILHVLLSFAQFEREQTSERIRDKISASKRRGMWMGGVVPFGYRVQDRKLLPREDEAPLVRQIFERFVELGSATVLARGLAAGGIVTRSGRPFDKAKIYKLVSNPVYIGKIRHGEQIFDGQHDPIVPLELWDRVHAILQQSPRTRAGNTRRTTPALLKGLIFGPDGGAMSPSHTRKNGRLYRYYISRPILRDGAGTCPVGRIPASEIEAAVTDLVRRAVRDPEVIVAVWREARAQTPALVEQDVRQALHDFDPLWDHLFPAEQARIVQLLVERVDVTTSGAQIRLRVDGLSAVAADLGAGLTRAPLPEALS